MQSFTLSRRGKKKEKKSTVQKFKEAQIHKFLLSGIIGEREKRMEREKGGGGGWGKIEEVNIEGKRYKRGKNKQKKKKRKEKKGVGRR